MTICRDIDRRAEVQESLCAPAEELDSVTEDPVPEEFEQEETNLGWVDYAQLLRAQGFQVRSITPDPVRLAIIEDSDDEGTSVMADGATADKPSDEVSNVSMNAVYSSQTTRASTPTESEKLSDEAGQRMSELERQLNEWIQQGQRTRSSGPRNRILADELDMYKEMHKKAPLDTESADWLPNYYIIELPEENEDVESFPYILIHFRH